MKKSDKHAEAWRLLGQLMAISVVMVIIAAYGISHNIALNITTDIIKATNSEFLGSLLVRFSSYNSPYNALLAVLASWLTSPLSFFAGYIFTRRIIRENIVIHAPSSGWLLFLRALFIFIVFIVSLYAVVMLPGLSSVYCEGCEQNSMMFMLAVSVVGFWCVGALFGTVTTLLKIIFH